MKKAFKLMFAAALAAILLPACNREDSQPNGDDSDNAVYASVTISLPKVATTKSDINYADIEYGQTVENTITSINVTILKNDNTVIASASESGNTLSSPTVDGNPVYLLKFDASAFNEVTDTEVKVHVICNDNTGVGKNYNTTFSHVSADWDGFSTSRSFRMTSSIVENVPFSATDLLASRKDNPYNLNNGAAIHVERTIARFDFKQKAAAEGIAANTYDVMDQSTTPAKKVGSITFKKMALVNDAKTAYYFSRFEEASDGATTNAPYYDLATTDDGSIRKYTAAGKPVPRFLVTPDPKEYWYQYPTQDADGVITSTPASLSWKTITDLTTVDNDNKWNQGTPSYGDYHIWRYVNENTNALAAQKKGVSTGVCFMATLVVDESKMYLASETDHTVPLYIFDNVMYGSFNRLKTTVSDPAETNRSLKANFNAVWGDPATAVEGSPADGVAAANGFKILRWNGIEAGYPLYYLYLNRHIDNGLPTEMGKMEFAVVRNNVYKLSIGSVSMFGHTSDPKDDPDPDDPDDPDEEDDIYMRVAVQVHPWTVRINEINF